MKLPLVAFAAPILASAAQPDQPTCEAPIPVPVHIAAATPRSTYYSDDEPPARFAHIPNHSLRMSYGKAEIERLCGKPPCGLVFMGCTKGDEMALPDPFSTDPVLFAHLLRHELGHASGWPATHGA